jgi:hypothetical protein
MGTGLDVLGDAASLDAGGADTKTLGDAGDQGPDVLDIGVPAPVGDVVGVGNVVPELGLLTANFALTGHGNLTNTERPKPEKNQSIKTASKGKS